MNDQRKTFRAVVLAGDRGPADHVAQAAGVNGKSLVPVGGTPMVLRVLDALQAAESIRTCLLCGPSRQIIDREPTLQTRLASGKVQWIPSRETPSASTYHALNSLSGHMPVLVTTADHALLSSKMVDYFCAEALSAGGDVVAAIARHQEVVRAFPGTRRTATRLRDGAFCSCNLYAFLTPRSRRAAKFWQRVENQRKKPWRLIRTVGWIPVVRYLVGRLTLSEALRRLSNRLELRVQVVEMPFPEAAVDVDSVEDWHLVQTILAKREAEGT